MLKPIRHIDRAFFVPQELQSRAYENSALPIGDGQTISQPLVVAYMLEFLGLQAGDTVLEIGTGSGWKSALVTFLIGTSLNISYGEAWENQLIIGGRIVVAGRREYYSG